MDMFNFAYATFLTKSLLKNALSNLINANNANYIYYINEIILQQGKLYYNSAQIVFQYNERQLY